MADANEQKEEAQEYKFDFNALPRQDVGPTDPEDGPMAQILLPKLWVALDRVVAEGQRTTTGVVHDDEKWWQVEGMSTDPKRIALFNNYQDASLWSDLLYLALPLFQDWLAKDKALRVVLARLVGAEHISDITIREHYESLTNESQDLEAIVCYALGHKPLQDNENAPDLMRRVFVLGTDRTPDDDDAEGPPRREKPCPHTIALEFSEEEK